jgi:hypothetical protein
VARRCIERNSRSLPENVYADHGSFNTLSASSTVSDSAAFGKLCVDDICVTRDQFKAMVEGSVLGASQSAAADVPIAEPVAPAAPPAPLGNNADATITTISSTLDPITSASSTPDIAPPANNNPQPRGAEQSSHDDNEAATSAPEAANDNPPPSEEHAATGTQ